MEFLLKSRLAMLSGWGTGLAVLFVMFSEVVTLNDVVLGALDNLLSVCVAIFFVLTFSAVSVGLHAADQIAAGQAPLSVFKGIQGVMFIAALLVGGWLLLDSASDVHGATKTAVALGALVAGSGVIAAYFVVIKLCKRKNA